MWFYAALFAVCIGTGIVGILAGGWLLKKITECSADYLPHYWDFDKNKEAEGQ